LVKNKLSKGEDLTNLAVFLILTTELSISFNPAHAIRLTTCAQHLTCIKSFDNILVAHLIVTLYRYFIVKLFELVLSTVTIKILSIPLFIDESFISQQSS